MTTQNLARFAHKVMRLFSVIFKHCGWRFTYNEQSFWHFATKLCILNRTALDRISKDRKSNASLSSLKSWQKIRLKKPHKGNTGKGPFICLESRTFFCLNSWNQLTFMKKVTYLLTLFEKSNFWPKIQFGQKPQHFHVFFTQIFFWQFFSWNESCQ